MNKYEEKGFKTREDYLNDLSNYYGVDYGTVVELASVLGKGEDFDGLINSLEDISYGCFDLEDEEEWVGEEDYIYDDFYDRCLG